MRIGLAALPFASSPEASLANVQDALHRAAALGAGLVCTPECYIPGQRGVGRTVAPPDPAFLAHAERCLVQTAADTGVSVIVGTERATPDGLFASALVITPNGVQGWQDKVQLDPSEDGLYTPGTGRRLFEIGGLRFGISICHERWRYPETVRWAARRGAHIVFHPHFMPEAEPGREPHTWADPANSFHEKAVLCRAAENGLFMATVNYAILGSITTTAVIAPDGSAMSWLPYGETGLLVADIDPVRADTLLARRLRLEGYT